MAYQIQYGSTLSKRNEKVRFVSKRKWVIIICIFVFAASLLQLKPVQDLLIPGDPIVTRAAFQSFKSELKNGEHFYDAAAVFCRQVIEADLLA